MKTAIILLTSFLSMLTSVGASAAPSSILKKYPESGLYRGHFINDEGSWNISGDIRKSRLDLDVAKNDAVEGYLQGRLYLRSKSCFKGHLAQGGYKTKIKLINCLHDIKTRRLIGEIVTLYKRPFKGLNATAQATKPSLLSLQHTDSTPVSSGNIYFNLDLNASPLKWNILPDPSSSNKVISNYDDLMASNIVAGALLGRLLRESYSTLVVNRDQIYTSIFSHLLKEAGDHIIHYQNGKNDIVSTDDDQQTIMRADQGGPYQINDWTGTQYDISWPDTLHYGLVNFVSLQKVIYPSTVDKIGQSYPYVVTPGAFNNKYVGPLIAAYRKYLVAKALVHNGDLNYSFDDAKQYQLSGCLATLTPTGLVNFPQGNILDMILTTSYNSGTQPTTCGYPPVSPNFVICNPSPGDKVIRPVSVELAACNNRVDAVPAMPLDCKSLIQNYKTIPLTSNQVISCVMNNLQLSSKSYHEILGINEEISSPGGKDYPAWVDYARIVRYTNNQMIGLALENGLNNPDWAQFPDVSEVNVNYDADIVLSRATLKTIFENGLSQLLYKDVNGKVLSISTEDIDMAFDGAFNTTDITYSYGDNAQRKKLFDALDKVYDNLAALLAGKSTNFNGFGDMTQTQLYIDAAN